MKKVFVLIAFLILLVLTIGSFKSLGITSLENFLTYSVCDQPIHYKIDRIDPQFERSRSDFLYFVKGAAEVWNEAYGKNLFIYDGEGGLSVSLIYDERQSLTSKINKLEGNLKSEQQTLKPEVNHYKTQVAEFKQKIADLNKEIDYWNNQGGAPPEEYKKITERQQELKSEASRLNTMAQNLNISTNLYNSQVNQLNQTISTLENALEERPEEGIFKYPENRIEIYFDINDAELIHTLTHEFGHSLGLEHLNNPKSIMYFKTNQSVDLTQDDIQALEYICRRRSIFELFQHYINLMMIQYKK